MKKKRTPTGQSALKLFTRNFPLCFITKFLESQKNRPKVPFGNPYNKVEEK
ncbi:hypothetical protein WUBG_07041, partial [Wuchereria bancrofti]